MRSRISRLKQCLLVFALFAVVSGQLAAYPQICAMPGMEPNAMAAMELAGKSPAMNLIELADSYADTSDEQDAVGKAGFSNCDQICGYCLSPNLSGPDLSGQLAGLGATQCLDMYSPFVPAECHINPFRPPISV